MVLSGRLPCRGAGFPWQGCGRGTQQTNRLRARDGSRISGHASRPWPFALVLQQGVSGMALENRGQKINSRIGPPIAHLGHFEFKRRLPTRSSLFGRAAWTSQPTTPPSLLASRGPSGSNHEPIQGISWVVSKTTEHDLNLFDRAYPGSHAAQNDERGGASPIGLLFTQRSRTILRGVTGS